MAPITQLKKDLLQRGRFTPGGRLMLNAAAVALEPLEYVTRRRAAARYNRRFPSHAMSAADGHAVLPAGSLPGTDAILDACRGLFERKRAAVDAAARIENESPKAKKKKGSFLKNLLDNDDLAANPVLVDFALSDALFSVVTNYLGVIPTLNRIDLIYSVPSQADAHISSQLFHQDPEGLRQAKVFLNVFDVEDPHGPFTFIPASQSERIVLAVRDERRAAGAKESTRISDAEVAAHGGHAELVRLTGPAGTAGVIDTSRCLHLGSRVAPGHIRLCLFIQYCTSHEKANTFDARRFIDDPVRWLALKRFAADAGSA